MMGLSDPSGMIKNSRNVYEGSSCAESVKKERKTYTRFLDWLDDNDWYLKERCSHIYHIDPDIMCLKLPMTTKFRMQRQRNYQRMLEEKKKSFIKILNIKGSVGEHF